MFHLSIDKNNILAFFRRFYILIVLAIIYIPLIFLVALSFTGSSSKGNIILDFSNPTLGNWSDLFTDSEFIGNFLNSLNVTLVVTPIAVIIGIITSFGLWNSNKKTKKILNTFSSINISIPDVITGISLTLLFASVWIPLGLDYGYITVVIAHISFTVPYAIVAIYPRMMSLKQNLINASNDLGASKIRTFFKVIVPHIMPSIISAAVIVIAISFDDFIITLLVSGNFTTISSIIYLSSKGIKAWIVTFGALLVILFIIGSILIAIFKVHKEKNKGKKIWK